MSAKNKRPHESLSEENDQTSIEEGRITKKLAMVENSVLGSMFQPSESTTPPKKTTNKDFCIVAGSYERILYGIDAQWNTDADSVKLRLEPVFIFPAHGGCIKTVAIGRQFLASGSSDEIIKLYNMRTRKELGSLLANVDGTVTALTFHGHSHMLSATDLGAICIWRTKDWECLRILKGHIGRVNAVAIHPTGRIALSVGADRTVRLWNLVTGHKASATKLAKEGENVQWNLSGSHYAILFDREIYIYSTDAIPILKINQTSRINCMQFYCVSDTSEYIISGGEDGIIRAFNAETGSCRCSLLGHANRIKALDIIRLTHASTSPGEPQNILVTASSDGSIKCWDLDKAISTEGEVTEVLGEYETRSRLTCLAVAEEFDKYPGERGEAEGEEEKSFILESNSQEDGERKKEVDKSPRKVKKKQIGRTKKTVTMITVEKKKGKKQ